MIGTRIELLTLCETLVTLGNDLALALGRKRLHPAVALGGRKFSRFQQWTARTRGAFKRTLEYQAAKYDIMR